MALNSLFPLALILTGVLASTIRLTKKETFDKIPDLLFSVCYPCIIIQSIGKTNFSDMLAENAYAMVFAAVLTPILLLLGLFAAKIIKDENKKPVIIFAMMINNSTYIGLPVAQMLYGARGVAFVVIFGAVQDLFVWTIGYRMFDGQKNNKALSAFANPVIISVILAFVLSLIGAPDIPVFDEITAAFGSMAVPLALFYIGYILASDKNAVLRIRSRVLVLSLIKVILLPIITALIMVFLPVSGFHKTMSIILAGFPIPVLTVMLSKQFGKDSDFTVEFLLCSTIMYLLLIPVIQLL